MASLFKQKVTRPLPEGAEIFTKNGERWARWTVNGKTKTARVVGEGDAMRIRTESSTWYARITLADGRRKDYRTGCRDKSAADSRANKLQDEQEKITAGIFTKKEADTAKHGRKAYIEAVEEFIQSMTARKCAEETCKTWKRYLELAGVDGIGWRTLHDMDRAELERYLSMRAVTPKDPEKPESVMGARVHNAYVTVFNAFGVWCDRQGYTNSNMFADTDRRDEKADRRHIRRALTPDELARLIEAAEKRPLMEALKGNKGRGDTTDKKAASLSAKSIDALKWRGRVRAMAYWTAAGTGLRWGELRSITLGAVRLDADTPHIILHAKDEKARRGAQIPLHSELAAGLGLYIQELRSRLVGQRGASVVEFPGALDSVPLFDVPEKMTGVFHDDCEAAKIARYDGAGRAVDVHALRHTFGTMLAKAGVSLQVAQKAMRHSDPKLTANVYTHLGLMDVAGAVEKLPIIATAKTQAAEMVANSVTPTVTPNSDNSCKFEAIRGKTSPLYEGIDTLDKNRILANKIKVLQEKARKNYGAPGETRTHDPLLRRQVLYPN